MEFRTIVIRNPSKLSYKDGFLIVRGDEVKTIHLSEIHSLVIESTMTTITGYLVTELMKNKINVVFCDEKRDPVGELHPCYGSQDTSRRVAEQADWDSDLKQTLWQSLIRQKICSQGKLLEFVDKDAAQLLFNFAKDVLPGDTTNREGHAAKVYFNRIFGQGFTREEKCCRNAALNYGYAILLSTINKEVVGRGYCTQLGIHHHNTFNRYNLSCDLMEPFRCLIDSIVLRHKEETVFDQAYKEEILDVLNRVVIYDKKRMALTTAITRYVRNTTEYLSGRIEWTESMVYHFEDETYEADSDV